MVHLPLVVTSGTTRVWDNGHLVGDDGSLACFSCQRTFRNRLHTKTFRKWKSLNVYMDTHTPSSNRCHTPLKCYNIGVCVCRWHREASSLSDTLFYLHVQYIDLDKFTKIASFMRLIFEQTAKLAAPSGAGIVLTVHSPPIIPLFVI